MAYIFVENTVYWYLSCYIANTWCLPASLVPNLLCACAINPYVRKLLCGLHTGLYTYCLLSFTAIWLGIKCISFVTRVECLEGTHPARYIPYTPQDSEPVSLFSWIAYTCPYKLALLRRRYLLITRYTDIFRATANSWCLPASVVPNLLCAVNPRTCASYFACDIQVISVHVVSFHLPRLDLELGALASFVTSWMPGRNPPRKIYIAQDSEPISLFS